MAALLGNDDLFVVQLQDSIHPVDQKDQILSVKFDTIRDSAVHLAIAGTRNDSVSPYEDGDAGIMYPGQGFYYDESTGRLDIRIDSDLKFIDVLREDRGHAGSGDNQGKWRQTPFWDNSVDADGNPVTRRGNFYVCGDPDIYLSDSWVLQDPTKKHPNIGDLVICIDDSVPGATGDRDTHLWSVIQSPLGAQAVLQVRTSTPDPSLNRMGGVDTYSEVITDDPTLGTQQRPLIRVRKAGFVVDASDTVDGGYYVGGLVDEYDKEKIDTFDLNLYKEGWVKSLILKSGQPTDDSLKLTEIYDPSKAQYKDLILEINQAKEDKFGVVDIAKEDDIKETIFRNSADPNDTLYPAEGRTDEVVMTPEKTRQHFVPRMFRTLPNLESAAHHGP